MAVIELSNIYKSFASQILLLDDISLKIEKGQSVAIIGKSGTGKSTLLHMAGLLDRPTSGKVLINGQDTSVLPDKVLSELRNKNIGFVFQSHLLLEDFNALENVMVPALIAGSDKDNAEHRAKDLLDKMGLSDRLNHSPSKLSGGEKQRIAICRALINNPDIIMADEPTGSLDEENAQLCENLFMNMVETQKTALLLVTHNRDFAMRCSTVYEIKNHILNKVK